MTARYWIAKHIPDVFRNEPRNIGVIVNVDGQLCAQFVAEREDGSLDGRALRKFEYADVYRQWVDFWRDEVLSGSLDYLVQTVSPNFLVHEGGEVQGYETDEAGEVCRFLFTSLVGSGIAEAFGWEEVEAAAVLLEQDVSEQLIRFNLISTGDNLLVRNPVQRHRPVNGAHAVHTPDFVQTNGHLSAFETVDFTTKQTKRVRDRAGWAAYMFSDIREAHRDLESYAIVRVPESLSDGSLEYAHKMLSSEATIVNWLDASARGRFLEERARVADAIQPILASVTRAGS